MNIFFCDIWDSSDFTPIQRFGTPIEEVCIHNEWVDTVHDNSPRWHTMNISNVIFREYTFSDGVKECCVELIQDTTKYRMPLMYVINRSLTSGMSNPHMIYIDGKTYILSRREDVINVYNMLKVKLHNETVETALEKI